MADNNNFQFVENTFLDDEISRPSLTYWQDAWRRLKKNKLAMIGVVAIIFIIFFGVVGPSLTDYTYSDQLNKFKNLPPTMEVFDIGDDANLYLSSDYNMFLVNDKGEMVERLEIDKKKKDLINKVYVYKYGTEEAYEEVILDFSYNLLKDKQGYEYDYTIEYNGTVQKLYTSKKMNRTFPFGTDDLGRDILTRVMYGTRISLMIAFIATLVNLFIGIIYGSVAGFCRVYHVYCVRWF